MLALPEFLTHFPKVTEWTLAGCKIIGVVGAYVGLIERIDEEKHPTPLRTWLPVVFLAFAVSAEIIDADLKHEESLHEAARYDRLANPINHIDAGVSLLLPQKAINELSPAYFTRMSAEIGAGRLNPWGEFDAHSKSYPSAQKQEETAVWQALNASYDTQLSFFTPEEVKATEDAADYVAHSNFAVDLEKQTEEYRGGQTSIVTDRTFPPSGRELRFNTSGILINDPLISLDLKALAPERYLQSLDNLTGSGILIEVCPHWEDWNTGLVALPELARVIQVERITLRFDRIGTIEVSGSDKEFAALQLSSTASCAQFFYKLPKTPEGVQQLLAGHGQGGASGKAD